MKRDYRKIALFWRNVKIPRDTDCILWKKVNWNGYGRYQIGNIQTSAHRASYIFHKGPVPDEMDVRHSCDIRNCVNPDHLSIGTRKDNMKDMIDRNRTIRKRSAYISREKIKEIAALRDAGTSYEELEKITGLPKRRLLKSINNHNYNQRKKQ